MRIWTIANQKGGVGKTTTSVALAGLLAAQGQRTLLLDLDPQGSLTSYLRYDPDLIEASCYDLFKAVVAGRAVDPLKLVHDTGIPGLSLVPASTALATLDRQSAKIEGFGLVIERALRQLSEAYDYALIDCPPVLGVLLINALAAGDYLLLPVPTEFLAIKGLERMLRSLEIVLRSRPRALPYLILPTFFDQRTRAARESLEVLQRNYPEHLWGGVIPLDTAIREASAAGVPPSVYQPRARGTRAYRRLLNHLLAIPAAQADRHTGSA